MPAATKYENDGAVAVVTFTSPPVNALGFELRCEILEGLQKAQDDEKINAIVLMGDGRCFSGGADIREFGKPSIEPSLHKIIAYAETSSKPIIAAIHETAVGGALELALGCHYRIGTPTAKLGSPEIKLGLIPGAGATQRLPRLIGVEAALDVILGGEFFSTKHCLDMGLLDRVITEDLRNGAVSFANDIINRKEALPVIRNIDAVQTEDNARIFATARNRIERRSRELIAPAFCIEAIKNVFQLPFDDGLARERELFLQCIESEQSRAQRHVFFAERTAMRIPNLPNDVVPRSIEIAAVIGAGTMGGGIAMNFANANIPVRIIEVDDVALDRGLNIVRKNYTSSVSRGRIDQNTMDRALSLISGSTEIADAANADIVIEAITEDLDAKRDVFRALDRICKKEAILASNTSTLDIDALATATSRPTAVIGTHFFSPANIMKLMENVRGAETAPDVIATVIMLARRMGKVPVLARVCDGFIGNRMLHAYTRQANFLLEDGALPHQIDRVICEFGFPMGPFAMGDLAGLDIGWAIRKHRANKRDSNERYSSIADRICELGRFGQKTGAGWYRYEEGSRTPIPDPEIEALIVGTSDELSIKRRTFSDKEILERCMLTLINEGARILEEGIAIRASDIDITWIYGYGFPIHRGGPMYYADQLGINKVYDGLKRLEVQQDNSLKPASLIERLARDGGQFGKI